MLLKNFSNSVSSYRFILDILNGMKDWVRVIDKDGCVIFMNRPMKESLKSERSHGRKCYEILGRSYPCENCISRKAVFKGKPYQKEEIFGGKIFSVMSSPIIDDNGNIPYVVEVLRDITKDKELENKLRMQNDKLQKNLDIAKKIQLQLLPKNSDVFYVNFAYLYHPCETLSGDFFHIFNIDQHHTGIYIADVSGHGILASMLTVFLYSTFNKKTLSPAKALKKLHRSFNKSDLEKDLYITLFYAIYNSENNTITYSNAGHNCPPILVQNNSFKRLYLSGTPISDWINKPDYTEITIPFRNNDTLLFYTDGVSNKWLEYPEKLFYDSGFINILKDSQIDLKIMLNLLDRYILKKISEYGEKIEDDITLALIRPK